MKKAAHSSLVCTCSFDVMWFTCGWTFFKWFVALASLKWWLFCWMGNSVFASTTMWCKEISLPFCFPPPPGLHSTTCACYDYCCSSVGILVCHIVVRIASLNTGRHWYLGWLQNWSLGDILIYWGDFSGREFSILANNPWTGVEWLQSDDLRDAQMVSTPL